MTKTQTKEIIETYRGVTYAIRILYDKQMTGTDKGRWAVLEYPDMENEFYKKLGEFVGEYSDFLYKDTLHTYNDGQSIEKRIKQMRDEAHYDIDQLFIQLALAKRALLAISEIKSVFTEPQVSK